MNLEPEETIPELLLKTVQGLAAGSLFGIAIWHEPLIGLVLLLLTFIPGRMVNGS